MTFTTGQMLLYGGIAGIVVFSLVGILVMAVLRGKRKKLLRAIEEEYQ